MSLGDFILRTNKVYVYFAYVKGEGRIENVGADEERFYYWAEVYEKNLNLLGEIQLLEKDEPLGRLKDKINRIDEILGKLSGKPIEEAEKVLKEEFKHHYKSLYEQR